jgi:hypothetical protein
MKSVATTILLLFAIAVTSLQSQQIKTFNAKDGQFLSEVKGMVVFKTGKLILEFIAPSDQREDDYKKVDLQTGDEIQFISGKKANSIEDFKKYYEEIKEGNELKLGIKRGEVRMIVAFKKGKTLKGAMKVMTFTSDGNNSGKSIKITNGKAMINGKEINLDSLKKSGAKVITKQK